MSSWIIILWLIFFIFLCWKNQRVGLWLILLMIPTYLLQFNIFSVPTTLLEISVYVLALVFAIKNMPTLSRLTKQALQPIFLPLVLLAIGLCVGVLVTPDIRLALGIFKGWFVDPIVLYVLIVSLVEWEKIKHYSFALVLSTIPISVVAIGQVVTNEFVTVDGRASAWFDSANYLSMYLVPVMLLGLILVTGVNKLYRWVTLFALCLGLVALFFSYSYGGWLALVCGLVAIGVISLTKNWRVWAGGLVVFIGAALSQLGNPKLIDMLDFGGKSSLSVRLQVWETGLLMIKENWLTGIGLGQFRDQYLDFASRVFSPPLELAILHAHSLYFQFWVNTGLLGLIGFVFLIIKFYQLINNKLNINTVIILASFSSIIVHGLIDSTYWKNDLSMIFWVLMAYAIIWNRTHIYQPNNK